MTMLAGMAFFLRPSKTAEEYFERAELYFSAGKITEAESACREALRLQPNYTEALILAADCAESRGDYGQAVDDLSKVSTQAGEAWLDANLRSAGILKSKLYRLGDSENVYQEILEMFPNHVVANEEMARLLGLCGRRAEAIPHVLRVLQAGERTDLLILLARESVSIADPEYLNKALRKTPDDPNPLLGLAQIAMNQQQPKVALEHLLRASKLKGLPASFRGMLGKCMLANEMYPELEEWSAGFGSNPKTAESWVVMAELAERSDDRQGAIRCYWEAAKINPAILITVQKLGQLLTREEKTELAAPFQEWVENCNILRDLQQVVIMSNEEPEPHQVLELIAAYQKVGRLLEAYGWANVAIEYDPDNVQISKARSHVQKMLGDSGMRQTIAKKNPALNVDLSHYPVPHQIQIVQQGLLSAKPTKISFRKQASDVGLNFRYYNGSDSTTYKMYGFAGGGIAALDFDKDGFEDLYFTQGHPWERLDTSPSYSDRLFRNIEGARLVDVIESNPEAFQQTNGSDEMGFGQGVAAGDFNNDGFTDLYVGSTGKNRLWMNNGDGTFSRQVVDAGENADSWTTSCLIADLNGDTYPDLYDVNYLQGDGIFDRLCQGSNGQLQMCSPYDFEAANDQVWLGDGQGGFELKTNDVLNTAPNGKGLGIAAFTYQSRLALFVANDTTPNLFYVGGYEGRPQLENQALELGLAFNGEGKAEACMGIALHDYDDDGQMDLYVTNFLHESNTLYKQTSGYGFSDETSSVGLHDVSLPVLGFGTQFLDADLDGRVELFVNNGFTQDLAAEGTPYEMLPQLFTWTGQRFTEVNAQQLGEWATHEQVGRCVTKIDWNRDNKPDLAVGLIDESSYLLSNTSKIEGADAVSIIFSATQTARDAIGTEVTAIFDGKPQAFQLTAGDGYQCSNQKIVHIGCGDKKQIDALQIRWPSGKRQVFEHIPTGLHLLCVEGRKEWIKLPY